MAQNSTVIAALQANPVPPERECVKNLTDVLVGVQDFVSVVGLASAAQGTPLPTTNNTAAQALSTAQSALTLAQQLDSQQPEVRTSGTLVPVAAGDSVQGLTWAEDMPSTNYLVTVSLYGAATHPSAYYGWRVVAGTQQLKSVQVVFDNIPSGTSMVWKVESLP